MRCPGGKELNKRGLAGCDFAMHVAVQYLQGLLCFSHAPGAAYQNREEPEIGKPIEITKGSSPTPTPRTESHRESPRSKQKIIK